MKVLCNLADVTLVPFTFIAIDKNEECFAVSVFNLHQVSFFPKMYLIVWINYQVIFDVEFFCKFMYNNEILNNNLEFFKAI